MREKEFYDYLNNISLIEIINYVINNKSVIEEKNQYYTVKDLIEKYPNVFSKYKIDKYIKNYNLPVIKYGKDRLFVKSEIEVWLDNRSKEIYGSRD